MFKSGAVYFLLDKSTSKTSSHATASHLLLKSSRKIQGKNSNFLLLNSNSINIFFFIIITVSTQCRETGDEIKRSHRG